jgi:DNA replication ATP-dependent helicase Dna2
VNVIGNFKSACAGSPPSCIIDESQNFIIVHPDILLSATTVSDAYSCPRRAVLSELFRDSASNFNMVQGIALHQVLQQLLVRSDWSDEAYAEVSADVTASLVQDLYAVGVGEETLLDAMSKAFESLRTWASQYVSHLPKVGADMLMTFVTHWFVCLSCPLHNPLSLRPLYTANHCDSLSILGGGSFKVLSLLSSRSRTELARPKV